MEKLKLRAREGLLLLQQIQGKMNSILDYIGSFFMPATVVPEAEPEPEAAAPEPVPELQKDVRICYTRDNILWVVNLSQVKLMKDKDELRQLAYEIQCHVAETYDPEGCENGNLILAEIQKMIDA
jgi:hypothetical protein